jgi:hypothetical protein
MSNNQVIKIIWSKRFPLRDVCSKTQNDRGLYLWGFDDHDGKEVIWYVGMAHKGLYTRLRQHYLDVMGCKDQIPIGFLNGEFNSRACSESGWKIRHRDAAQAAILEDWAQMERVFRGGHRFANNAFVRVAVLDVDKDKLSELEKWAIGTLRPKINSRGAKPNPSDSVIEVIAHEDEHDWVEDWLQRRAEWDPQYRKVGTVDSRA